MSLILLVVASSFFFPKVVVSLLNKNTQSAFILQYAEERHFTEYDEYQVRNQPYGSAAWLQSSINLVKKHPHYTLELAKYFRNESKVDKAIFWFQQAIQLNLSDAKLPLGILYYERKNNKKANKLLLASLQKIEKLTENQQIEVFEVLLKIAVDEGDFVNIRRFSAMLSAIKSDHELLKQLNGYQVLSINDKPSSLHESCVASVQFFATNIDNLNYLERLIEQAVSHPISAHLCFEPIRYISLKELACTHTENKAISCDESIWEKYQNNIQARYVGVLVPKGGANVHNGIMYLDREDTIDVLTHELSHFAGFIDEYSLPENHSRCSNIQNKPFAHNTAVLRKNIDKNEYSRIKLLAKIPWAHLIEETTPLFSEQKGKKGEWVIGTPITYKDKVGLFPSETCAKRTSMPGMNIQSFKPVYERTSLQYFELPFPKFYQKLLDNNASRYLMPSFHYNIQLSTLESN